MKKILLISLLLSLVISCNAITYASNSSTEYQNAFDRLILHKVIDGNEFDDNFDEKISRGEFAKLLVKSGLLDLKPIINLNNDIPYPDINAHSAKEYIISLYEAGHKFSYADNKFYPDNEIEFPTAVAWIVQCMGHQEEVDKIDDFFPTNYFLVAQKMNLIDDITIENMPMDCTKGDAYILLYNLLKSYEKYSDVEENDWYYDAILDITRRKIMNGMSDIEFMPNNNLTRGMLVRILYRYASANETLKATFSDVPETSYYSEAIYWASKNNIVNGIGDNKFNPEANITRQDLATIIYRYLKMQGNGFNGLWMFQLDFKDRDKISEYAYEPMCYLTMKNVITGKGEQLIAPNSLATRAEAAVIFQRLSNLNEKQDVAVPTGLVIVPSVIGEIEEIGIKKLTDIGLIPNVQVVNNSDYADGFIISQMPIEGELVSELTSVTIVVNNTENEEKNEVTSSDKRLIHINLSNKGEKDEFEVKVTLDNDEIGTLIEYEKKHSREDGVIEVLISNIPGAHLKMYIDGVLDSEQILF